MLPTPSQNCAKTSHFCAPTAQVRSKVLSLYNPFCSIFVNFHSRYTRDWKQAKESFMIVRFWRYDRNCVERVPPPQPCERLRFLRHPPECFRDKPARRQGGAYPEFEIPVYPIARLLRRRRAHNTTGLLAMTSVGIRHCEEQSMACGKVVTKQSRKITICVVVGFICSYIYYCEIASLRWAHNATALLAWLPHFIPIFVPDT